MRGRDFFFKPYRERIHEMYQHHDSLYDDENVYEENRNYSPYSKHQRRYSPDAAINYSAKDTYRPHYEDNYEVYARRDKENKRKQTYAKSRLMKEMHEPTWEFIYHKGMQMKEKWLEKHELEKNKIDTECTFTPNIKKNSRYAYPTSSFMERNNIWLENKIEKIVKEKEEEVVKGLEDCTFKPKINHNYKLKSDKYSYKNISPAKSMKVLPKKNGMMGEEAPKSVEKKKKFVEKRGGDTNLKREEVGKIKNLIRNQLKRIQL